MNKIIHLLKNINCILVASLILVACSTTSQPKVKTNNIQTNVSMMLAQAGVYQVALGTCLYNNDFANNDECSSGKSDIPEPMYNDIGSISASNQNVIISFNDDMGFPNNGMVILSPIQQKDYSIIWKCVISNTAKGQINPSLFPKSLGCSEIDGF